MDEGVIVLSEDELMENSFSTDDKQSKFVKILEHEKIKILLNKGQQSEVKKRKEEAMKLALSQHEIVFGRESNEYQIRKKIHNIKTALKKKAFGQPTVLLKPWQVRFMNILNEVEEEHNAMYGDSSAEQTQWASYATETNPPSPDTTPTISSVSSLQNYISDARKPQKINQNGYLTPSQNTHQEHKDFQQRKFVQERNNLIQNHTMEFVSINSSTKRRMHDVDESYDEDDEDDLKNPFELPETENLSMEQLQRLVLVKQLNLINIQTAREKFKLQKLMENSKN